MKNTMFIIVTVLCSLGVAQAGTIEKNLQAVIASPEYADAIETAREEVNEMGGAFQLTFGKTSTMRLDTREYFFYLPIMAVRVPLSPLDPVNVGSIVGLLNPGLNSALPYVVTVYFAPATIPAR